MQSMILAADIGGTKTRVALFQADVSQLDAPINEQSFPSKQYDSLDAIIKEYLAANSHQVQTACFGIAGPVVGSGVETANLPWHIDGAILAQIVGLACVSLINDLEATAYGIEGLRDQQLCALNSGDPSPGGNRALIAAGTGLGMAGIVWDGQNYRPLPSEGGHADFAPAANERQIDLLRYLSEKFGGHVSTERALSGPGLFNIYSFLRETKFAEEPSWLAEEIAGGDKTAAVSKAALANKSELAVKALDLFVEIYGATAGNLALIMKATGGLYVGGGMAPKIIEKLKAETFMRAFKDKGRMSALVASIPVHVILDDRAALYGAARRAFHNLR